LGEKMLDRNPTLTITLQHMYAKKRKKRKNQFVYSVNEGLSQLIDLTIDQGILRQLKSNIF
jgi:hypothetical protein